MIPKAKACALISLVLSLLFQGQIWSDETDLIWSTFLGGSFSDEGYGIAVDSSGNAYLTGKTESDGFPTTSGAFDETHNGGDDVFVVKLNPTGDSLDYATFLGGGDDDWGWGIAVDSSGNAYVTGETKSADFPTTAGAFDTSFNGSWRDVFVVKLNPTGDNLDYASFLGGGDVEMGYGIALDDSGNAYLTGETKSADFPTTAGAFDTTHGGNADIFVARLNSAGSHLDFATFVGGGYDDYGLSIALDNLGNSYLTGKTWSDDFPTTSGAYDTTYNGGIWGDVFVAKLNSMGSDLDYATFLGGGDDDWGWDIAVDNSGNAYLTGETWSDDFPTTDGVFDSTYDNVDAFVAKLNATGSVLVYSTFLGGSSDDYGHGIAVDDSGNVCVTGETWSDDFPTTAGAFDNTSNGNYDAFAAKLNATGSALDYGTFLGGNYNDYGRGIVVDNSGKARAIGWTYSSGFPTTAGAFDTTFNGGDDVFVARLKISGGLTPPEAVEDLRAILAGEDLFLAWSEVTADTGGSSLVVDIYRIYRDTVIYFFPGSLPFDSTANIFYVDTTGAVGDTLTHYYYTVTAVSGGKESELSGVVGEFDRSLSNPPLE